MTAETAEETEFDFSGINPEDVTGSPGPLSGSRVTGTSRTGAPRGRRSSKSKLGDLQTKLSGEMFQAGAMLGLALPTTGLYVCQESDAFTKAVVELASTRKEWIEALEHVAMVQPGIVVGRTMVGIVASVGVDRHRIDPEKPFIKLLGVYSAWLKLQEHKGVEGSAYREPPGTFSPVS